MSTIKLEDLEVFKLAEAMADAIWDAVLKWPTVARDTVGKQLIRATDSVGANVAEGYGRGTFPDNRRFIRIARGSLYESRFWLRRAYKRGLFSVDQVEVLKGYITRLGPLLNGYLRSIGRAKAQRSSAMASPE